MNDKKETVIEILMKSTAPEKNFVTVMTFHLRPDQHVTPAGTGMMVAPGNDTRDGLFILPVPCPCMSQRN